MVRMSRLLLLRRLPPLPSSPLSPPQLLLLLLTLFVDATSHSHQRHNRIITLVEGDLSPSLLQTIPPIDLFSFQLTTASSSTLNGTSINYLPSLQSGGPLPQSLPSQVDGLMHVNVMLPHSYDDITGCTDSWRIRNEFGQDFTEAFILMQQTPTSQDCPQQYLNVQQSGALGIISYGCSTSDCDPSLQHIQSILPGLTIPLISLRSTDGNRIASYLKLKRSEAVAASSSPPLNSLSVGLKGSGPLIASERAALINIMSQTSLGLQLNGTQVLPPWSLARFQNVAPDPCTNRTAGIWCENGRIVAISVPSHEWRYLNSLAPGPPIEFGAFTQLRYLNVANNYWTGIVPTEWCSITGLVSLTLSSQLLAPGITLLPACPWPSLQELQMAHSGLTDFPSTFSSWTNLRILDVSSTPVASMPSVAGLTHLEVLDLSNCQLTGSLPTLPALSLPSLRLLSLSANQLAGAIAPDAFDGFGYLEELNLSNNRFTGVLPSLNGCGRLSLLDLSSQRPITSPIGSDGFSGTVPTSWTLLTNLTTLYLQENSLSSPISTSTLTQLSKMDLSRNNFSGATLSNPANMEFTLWWNDVFTPSLVSVKLSYNSFVGSWSNVDLSKLQTIQSLWLDHNSFSSFPVEIFSTSLSTLDLSFNNLSPSTSGTFLLGTPSPSFQFLNLQGNPSCQYAYLPSWAHVTTCQSQPPISVDYTCPSLSVPSTLGMNFTVDPEFYQYRYCTCSQSSFGSPPYCGQVPISAEVNPYQAIWSDEVGPNFSSIVHQTNIGSILTPNLTGNSNVSFPQAFSDGIYGVEKRLTSGLSTAWVINLQNLFVDDPAAYAAAGLIPPSTLQTHTSASSSSLWTPVKVIHIRLHISAKWMTHATDVLSVYEGDSPFKGTRLMRLLGSDPKPTLRYSSFTSTPSYFKLYNSSLSLLEDPRLIEISVLSRQATVQFNSRSTSGLHFLATYSYDFTCPDGFYYDTVSNATNPLCRPVSEIYQPNEGIRSAIYVVSALALAYVILNITALLYKWREPVYATAAPPFLLLTLFLLGFMALGSLLYAAVPTAGTTTGDAICNGRIWLTALPLFGVLSIFLAKVYHLDFIFTAAALEVKVSTDVDIRIVVGVSAIIQLLMLSIFSGLGLTRAVVSYGAGSYSNVLVQRCSQESGFMSWMWSELIIIAIFMVATIYLIFSTRDLPTRFNESLHIQNAISAFIQYVCVIIPLVIYIQDDPPGAMLVQGLGQAVLCLLLTIHFFTPKLYYLTSLVITPSVNRSNHELADMIHGFRKQDLPPGWTNHSANGDTNLDSVCAPVPKYSSAMLDPKYGHPSMLALQQKQPYPPKSPYTLDVTSLSKGTRLTRQSSGGHRSLSSHRNKSRYSIGRPVYDPNNYDRRSSPPREEIQLSGVDSHPDGLNLYGLPYDRPPRHHHPPQHHHHFSGSMDGSYISSLSSSSTVNPNHIPPVPSTPPLRLRILQPSDGAIRDHGGPVLTAYASGSLASAPHVSTTSTTRGPDSTTIGPDSTMAGLDSPVNHQQHTPTTDGGGINDDRSTTTQPSVASSSIDGVPCPVSATVAAATSSVPSSLPPLAPPILHQHQEVSQPKPMPLQASILSTLMTMPTHDNPQTDPLLLPQPPV